MAPKTKRGSSRKSQRFHPPDPDGMFHGMVVFLVPGGVQARRLEIWKHKLTEKGAVIDEKHSRRVTHIFAVDYNMLLQQVNQEQLHRHKGSLLHYQWLENSLKSGEKVAEDPYVLNCQGANESDKSSSWISPEPSDAKHSNILSHKRIKVSCDDSKVVKGSSMEEESSNKQEESAAPENKDSDVHSESRELLDGNRPIHNSSIHSNSQYSTPGNDTSLTPENEADAALQSTYNPPDLNKNITEIFGKLIDIYRALGDERRSFSYYKAIPNIEKLPFKITSVDQVKDLPTIGKSLQDHIHEILTIGKLSKLEHFENDEKTRTVSLFGEVWGIGPATALKLYEKGHRTLDDLRHNNSLTAAQKIGLKYFDDIKKRIPRYEVKDMEMLLQKAAQEILPWVIVICGGSYRRGKASCGDLDIVITHPDGESHKGFLPRYVQHLKDINFLREDLVFSMHSTEGTDSGVDTYFGLCTYPGRELRHRIDLKVYPWDRYAFGLIAWTGNDVLNRRLRLLAESKGYRLDDTGLYLARTSSASPGKRASSKSSTRITCYTEKEVFHVLGFPWLEPNERNL